MVWVQPLHLLGCTSYRGGVSLLHRLALSILRERVVGRLRLVRAGPFLLDRRQALYCGEIDAVIDRVPV